jgi:outer membrane receptor for ferrienterochelin and colicins
MKSVFISGDLPRAISLSAVFILGATTPLLAQGQPVTEQDSTVTYPASFFTQYQPYSVNDMLERIPGINVARGGGGPQGGPGSSGGSGRRGLGAGGDQVLINGRRIAGKENEGNSQLARIPASQVDYIEIIRGTSGDLDVRGGNQVINVVLLEAESSSNLAFEANIDRLQDGTLQPGLKVSLNGQRGRLNYFLSAEKEPRYQYRDGFEVSTDADGNLNDTIDRDETTDAWPVTLVSNFGYEFSDRDIAHLNLQWTDNDFETETDRLITDYSNSLRAAVLERKPLENPVYSQ